MHQDILDIVNLQRSQLYKTSNSASSHFLTIRLPALQFGEVFHVTLLVDVLQVLHQLEVVV